MERQVFISYAANDPDWTAENVERLANDILQAGVAVRLDVWHRREMKRGLSDAEWQKWMAESLQCATNVVCLVSSRYFERWGRDENDEGGFGVAFESMRLVHKLYYRKQHNHGWISTLRRDYAGAECIPEDLAPDCPKYRWDEQRADLIEHLTQAEISVPNAATRPRLNATSQVAPSVLAADGMTMLSRELLRHQADHVVRSLQRASAYWAGLQRSVNLKNWLPAQCFAAPSSFVEGLALLSPDTQPRVMRELREIFKEKKGGFSGTELGDASSATVACYLFCACLLIETDACGASVGLPRLDSQEAARLLASVIALVMVGGRLELRPGKGGLPEGSGTYCVQLLGENEEADFERQLYAMLVLRPWSVTAGLKTGALSDSEREELLTALEDLRGDGDRTRAMCFVVESNAKPITANFGVARAIRVPVFHAHETIAYKLLGMTEAKLVSHLNGLWADVSSSLTAMNPQTAAAQPTLSDLMRELRALAEAMNQHVASKDIQVVVDALQRASDAKQKPERDILAKTKETLENLTQVGESGEKLISRLLQLLNFFM